MTLLSAMYRQGMKPAGCAVAAIIRACDSAGEWRKGLEVLRQAQRVQGSKPDPGSLSAAIEMCIHAGQTVSFCARCRRAREGVEGLGAWHAITLVVSLDVYTVVGARAIKASHPGPTTGFLLIQILRDGPPRG